MDFIDMHIHLQDYKSSYAKDIIEQSQRIGAKKFVCNSAKEEDWKKVSVFAKEFGDVVVPAFGLHPWHLNETKEGWESRIAEYFKLFPRALVGEAGLDSLKDADVQLQKDFFLKHIKLADKLHWPLIIHAVKAETWLDGFWKMLPKKFMFHSFNSHPEFLYKIMRYGGYVSFNAAILKNKNKQKIILSTPADRILVETDGPYQSGVKGVESNPVLIPELIAELAEIRIDKPEDLAKQIYKNSVEFIK
jgi:TatD DNase family protein